MDDQGTPPRVNPLARALSTSRRPRGSRIWLLVVGGTIVVLLVAALVLYPVY